MKYSSRQTVGLSGRAAKLYRHSYFLFGLLAAKKATDIFQDVSAYPLLSRTDVTVQVVRVCVSGVICQ